MKRVNSAGIVVFHRSANQVEYLLLHYIAGHWDFAKGHLEEGETNEEAATRELFEETGLSVSIIPGFQESFSYWLTDRKTGERVHKTVTFFVGEVRGKDVAISWEHQGFKWLPYKKALQQLTYANARQLLEKAHRFIEQK